MPYWIFVGLGVSIIMGLFCVGLYRKWVAIFWSIPFAIGLIFFMGLFATSIKPDDPRYSLRYTEDTPIYSLKTSDIISGTFCLGSGSIDSQTYYIYYIKNSDGSYSINKILESQSKLFLDRESGGVVTKVWAKINDENLSKHWGLSETIFSHYEIHIPYGSLVQDYSIR